MTELLVWSHAYSVGNEVVDDQHRKLIGFINTLYNIGDGPDAASDVEKVLGELIDYTVYHFGTEERLFAQHAYPRAGKHKTIHGALIDDVSAQLKHLAAGERAMREKLLVFLVDWLKDHILGEDKPFGKFLADQGAAEDADDL
jgi:hemerythrin-like metal-binding protein